MAQDVKSFINNLKKPFADMKLRKTSMLASFMQIIDTIGELQTSESKALNTAVASLQRKRNEKPVRNLPAPVAVPKDSDAPQSVPKTPVPTESSDDEKREDEQDKKDEQEQNEKSNSLILSLIGATKNIGLQAGEKFKEGLMPVQGELSNLNDNVVDSLFGPLSSIARSTRETATNMVKNVFGLAKDRFLRFRQWRRERKEAKAQIKAQKATKEAVEDLEKTTKRQFLIRSLTNMFQPLLGLLSSVFGGLGKTLFDPKVLAVALGAMIAKKLNEIVLPIFKKAFDDTMRFWTSSIKELLGIETAKEELARLKKELREAEGLKDLNRRIVVFQENNLKSLEEADKIISKQAAVTDDIVRLLEKDRVKKGGTPAPELQRPLTPTELRIKELEAILSTRKKEQDVVDVVRGGLVNVKTGDVVVDKESLADVLSGEKGSAVSNGLPSGREALEILKGIKDGIMNGNEATAVVSNNIQTAVNNVTSANTSQSDMSVKFFNEMMSRQEA